MTATMSFALPGQPLPWKRALRDGKRSFTNDKPRKSDGASMASRKRDFAVLAKMARPQGWPSTDKDQAFEVHVMAYFKTPRARRHGERHIAKPDIDNVAKLVTDALQGVLWHDDSQVAVLVASKFYDDTRPRTNVLVKALGRLAP